MQLKLTDTDPDRLQRIVQQLCCRYQCPPAVIKTTAEQEAAYAELAGICGDSAGPRLEVSIEQTPAGAAAAPRGPLPASDIRRLRAENGDAGILQTLQRFINEAGADSTEDAFARKLDALTRQAEETRDSAQRPQTQTSARPQPQSATQASEPPGQSPSRTKTTSWKGGGRRKGSRKGGGWKPRG